MDDWRSQADSLLRAAASAPSSHNTQPWRFRLGDATIDLLADRQRALLVNDPANRELAISCGCALFNLRVAAAADQLDATVDLLPDPTDPDWLARVRFAAATAAGPDAPLAGLLDELDRRRTHRPAFAAGAIDETVLATLSETAAAEGAWLRPVADSDREAVAALVAEGDLAQWADPAWRRELATWLRPPAGGDGLPVPRLVAPVARLVVGAGNLGRRVAAADRRLAREAPLLAILGTDDDQPGDHLVAGQALQRVLLVASGHGLQAAYLNQPLQVVALRPRLRGLAGEGWPQLLLRIGRPSRQLPAAPRRPLSNLLVGSGT